MHLLSTGSRLEPVLSAFHAQGIILFSFNTIFQTGVRKPTWSFGHQDNFHTYQNLCFNNVRKAADMVFLLDQRPYKCFIIITPNNGVLGVSWVWKVFHNKERQLWCLHKAKNSSPKLEISKLNYNKHIKKIFYQTNAKYQTNYTLSSLVNQSGKVFRHQSIHMPIVSIIFSRTFVPSNK